MVLSDLTSKTEDEVAFSQWLHATPMHVVSDEEIAEAAQELQQEPELEEPGDEVDTEGAAQPSQPSEEGVEQPEEGTPDEV